MSHRHLGRLARAALVLASGTALSLTLAVPSQAAPNNDKDKGDAFTAPAKQLDKLQDLKVAGPLRSAKGTVEVYVQFSGKGAYAATQDSATQNGARLNLAKPKNKKAEVKKIRSAVAAQAKSAAGQSGSKVIYQTSNALRGVALRGDAAKLRKLASRSDVVKVSAIVPKYRDNSGTDIDTKALDTWQKYNQTGEGVTIAVLDTGLDYTHADFGGPGTKAAYEKAKASTKLPGKKSGLYDPNKFKGGWDLVGDDYNADPAASSYQPVPHPDPNPLDCTGAGHGTHVAGTAAGYGVDKDGKTFKGAYSKLTADSVKSMRIGPGSAPDASLVSIRVFGCAGSSNVVGQALDYVLDPNGDGDFSDRAQIVNMSLGSDGSPVQDPENDIVDALAKQGILSVVASGNAGDVTDIGGSPGNSRSSLTVANSVGSLAVVDATDVTAPSDVAGSYGSQLSANYPWSGKETGSVVVPNGDTTITGCSAISDPAVKGKWVWLHWTDDPTGNELPCGSAVRFDNAKAAGAAGVVLDSPTDAFSAGIAGNTSIPGVQLTKSSGDKLVASAKAGTLTVSVDPAKRGTVNTETNALDSLNASSSRGVHGSDGIAKPDVAAPGTSIGSAGVGSGNGAAVMSGTSMATPHTAGIAALVASSGNYTPYQIKSLVMNTATKDVTRDGKVYGPHRVGSGRVLADAATTSPVIAYDQKDPDLTTSVFGVIEAAKGNVKATRTIELRNFSTKAQTYQAAYLEATTMPGVTVKVSKKKVTVPAKGIATVNVTVKVNGKQLGKTMDPTMDSEQLGVPRSFLADVTGRVQFTSATAPALRVPVSAAPKPVSALSVTKRALSAKKATLTLGGKGVDQDGYLSKVSALTLGATSPKLGAEIDQVASAREMDLQYVGANSTAPTVGVSNATLGVGVSTWGDWAVLNGTTQIQVDYDVNGDGKVDYSSYTTTVDDLDLTLVATVDAQGNQVDLQPLNGVFGDIDTNTYDTNVAVLPVALDALGVTKDNASKVRYRVATWSQYYADDNGNNIPVDTTKWIGYNPLSPSLTFQAPGTLLTDLPGQKLVVKVGDNSQKALLLHHQNGKGKRAEVVSVK